MVHSSPSRCSHYHNWSKAFFLCLQPPHLFNRINVQYTGKFYFFIIKHYLIYLFAITATNIFGASYPTSSSPSQTVLCHLRRCSVTACPSLNKKDISAAADYLFSLVIINEWSLLNNASFSVSGHGAVELWGSTFCFCSNSSFSPRY